MTHLLQSAMMGFVLFAFMPLGSEAATFGIAWEGSNEYSLRGEFSFSDSLLNTGVIDGTHIDTFLITGFQHGNQLGSFSSASGIPFNFNFNFDTITNTFLTGGISSSSTGQQWNAPDGSGFGFVSGNSFQALHVNGSLVSASILIIGSTVPTTGIVPSTLRPILNPPQPTPIPEPSGFALLAFGILGVLGYFRRAHSGW